MQTKTKFSIAFFILQVSLALNAGAQSTASEPPLPSIYVLKSVSDDRIKYFNEHKYSILDNVAKSNGASEELKEVYFKEASKLLPMLVDFSDAKKTSGMRIYFGSYGKGKVGDSAHINAGRFNFIFTATKNVKDITLPNSDVTRVIGRTYRTYQGNNIIMVSRGDAKKWVRNYQKDIGKRDSLKNTLTDADKADSCYETKYIFYENTKVAELKTEIEYMLKREKKAGLKIKLVSYTADDSIEGFTHQKIKQPFKQRLTLDFVFTDKNGKEVYLDSTTVAERLKNPLKNLYGESWKRDEKIKELFTSPSNSNTLNKMKELLSEDKYLDLVNRVNKYYTMDTGVPAPPPPGKKNMAKLDIAP